MKDNFYLGNILFSEIWLSWIKYEIEEAVTMVEKERIKNLFDEAVQDYLCESNLYCYYYISIIE